MIQFHKVTWYSKLATALFLFGVMPVVVFYMGMQYQEVKDMNQRAAEISYYAFNTGR